MAAVGTTIQGPFSGCDLPSQAGSDSLLGRRPDEPVVSHQGRHGARWEWTHEGGAGLQAPDGNCVCELSGLLLVG